MKRPNLHDLSLPAPVNAALTCFCAALSEQYGDTLQRVVLYGSWARNEKKPGADCDVAAFVSTLPSDLNDKWRKLSCLTETILDIEDNLGVFIHFFPPRPLNTISHNTPIMTAIRREGLDLL